MKKQNFNDDSTYHINSESSNVDKMQIDLNEQDLCDTGLCALELCISQEDWDYLNFLIRLSYDIVNDPITAKQFSENPESFINKYGYRKEIKIDEGLLKLILALGDEDINRAIHQNDVGEAVEIMESKGLLEDFSNVKISIPKKTLKDLYSNLGVTGIDDEAPDNCIAVALVLAVAFVLILVGIGADIAVVAYVVSYLDVESSINPDVANYILSKNLPLKLWSLKGDVEGGHIATNTYINNQVEKIINIIRKRNPKIFQQIDEQKLRNLIICNITKCM